MIYDKEYAKKLARQLLEINAVVLRPDNPFTWSSGWKSPIYCDNRLTLRYPEIRDGIAQKFSSLINEKLNGVEVITATATAGIPHAAWIAEKLGKPMAYVRSKAKSYGMGNQIEGGVDKNQSTLVIEDLVSTGSSAISVVDVLNFIGADVKAVLSIFTYDFNKSRKKFEDKEVPLYTLTDYNTLIEVAIKEEFVEPNQLNFLNSWREDPEQWPN